MNKFLRNKKALSPVVAAIILIAVTVAVAIAVAAWMGSMTFGFMNSPELTITNVEFTIGNASTGRITVHTTNTGPTTITVTRIVVNSVETIDWSSETSDILFSGNTETFTINHSVTQGQKYEIFIYNSEGTLVGGQMTKAK